MLIPLITLGPWDLYAKTPPMIHSFKYLLLILKSTGTQNPKVKFDSVFWNVDQVEYCCQKLLVGLAQHLKRVEIVGLDADCLELKPALSLVKFLLGDALMLEKLVLKAKRHERHEFKEKLVVPGKLLEFYQQLLCLPRAYENAELSLEGIQHNKQKGKQRQEGVITSSSQTESERFDVGGFVLF